MSFLPTLELPHRKGKKKLNVTPTRIAANSAIHNLWTDRTRKSSPMLHTTGAGPAEVWRCGVSTVHRDKGRRRLFRVHIWRIIFMYFIAHLTSAIKQGRDGFDCTLISKKSVPLTHSSTLHARKKDHQFLFKALTKSGQVCVQISCSITKHFVKISIT